MPRNVTQSFKLQRPDVESCRSEATLRLVIAEHCSTVWKHATVWKRSSRTACHTKNEVSCSDVAQNIDWKTIVGRKVYWPRPAFSNHAYWERVQKEKLNCITL